jgi:hypothetical protein
MTVDVRAQMQRVMRSTLEDEAEHGTWGYHAVRPCYMPTPARVWQPRTKVKGDCSKGCQFISYWSPPAPDPMGQGWGPFGNSQTLWLRCQHLDSPWQLKVGDFVTFGRDGHDHAACVLEAGVDPLMWGFGHQGAPNTTRLSWDRRAKQYLRNPLPDYVPTPEDRLRARTGWFAWMAWYGTSDSRPFGEGDWRHHKARDPRVRPNVPRVIPAGWWVRRARFLLRRNQANHATAAVVAP